MIRADEILLEKRAAAQALLGIVRMYDIFSDLLHGPAGRLPWSPSRKDIARFLVTIARVMAYPHFPASTGKILELLFHRTFSGMKVGLHQGEPHPFAELSSAERRAHGDTPHASRRRMVSVISAALTKFRTWCHDEQYFFRTRVMYNGASRPRTALTAKALQGAREIAAQQDADLRWVDVDLSAHPQDVSEEYSLEMLAPNSGIPLLSVVFDEAAELQSLGDGTDEHLEDTIKDGDPEGGSVECQEPVRATKGSSAASKQRMPMCHHSIRAMFPKTDAEHQAYRKSLLGEAKGSLREWHVRSERTGLWLTGVKVTKDDLGAFGGRFWVFSRRGVQDRESWRRQRWQMWTENRHIGSDIVADKTAKQSPTATRQFFSAGRRVRIIACGTQVFYVDALLVTGQSEGRTAQQAIEVLADAFGTYLWGFTEVPEGYPAEMAEAPTIQQLCEQYKNLQRLAQAVAQCRDVRGRCPSDPEGKSTPKTPQDDKLHVVLMNVKGSTVSQGRYKCWHILSLYHRFMMWSVENSMPNESWTSSIRYLEKKHATGHPMSVACMTRDSKLRFMGIRGDGRDFAVIMEALKLHFRKINMDRPRFFVTGRTLTARVKASEEAEMLDEDDDQFGPRLGPSCSVNTLRKHKMSGNGLEVFGARMFPWFSKTRGKSSMVKHLDANTEWRMRSKGQFRPDELEEESWQIADRALRKLNILR